MSIKYELEIETDDDCILVFKEKHYSHLLVLFEGKSKEYIKEYLNSFLEELKVKSLKNKIRFATELKSYLKSLKKATLVDYLDPWESPYLFSRGSNRCVQLRIISNTKYDIEYIHSNIDNITTESYEKELII
jgi:hypothetical protein